MIPSVPLYSPVPAGVESRWINPENPSAAKGAGGTANHGRKGAPYYGSLKPGETKVLADYSGTSGVIRHIWTTTADRSPVMNRALRIDIYWDGAATPAVSCPYGDFFGTGLGEMPVHESEFFSNPEGRNANCYLPMPFRSGFKMTVTNESDRENSMFWMQIDMTINDPVADALYLHAVFNRENPTTPARDYEFLPFVQGEGRYLGANFGIHCDGQWAGAWWGEGEVKLYLDGDRDFPTLCGTGCEDYIGTAWGQGAFRNRYQGCHLNDGGTRICMYRYHVPDPVWFHRDIRGTIQQMGYYGAEQCMRWHYEGRRVMRAGAGECIDTARAHGGLFERSDDWSSCAYLYLNRPERVFAPLMPVAARIAGLCQNTAGGKRMDI